jgi:hypothetical protein
VSGIGCVGRPARGQPSAADRRQCPVPGGHDGVGFSGRISAGGADAAARAADDAGPIRSGLPIRRGARGRHQNLDTAPRTVAAWPRCERIEMGGRGWPGCCEASASTPRDGTPSAAPLTTRCECRTVFPSRPSYGRSNLHWRQFALALGESNLSLADALRRRPRRHHRPHRYIARDVAGLTIRSSMARSIGAPPYFFLTAFRFAGAFFFAAGFAFALAFVVAFFAILPS